MYLRADFMPVKNLSSTVPPVRQPPAAHTARRACDSPTSSIIPSRSRSFEHTSRRSSLTRASGLGHRGIFRFGAREKTNRFSLFPSNWRQWKSTTSRSRRTTRTSTRRIEGEHPPRARHAHRVSPGLTSPSPRGRARRGTPAPRIPARPRNFGVPLPIDVRAMLTSTPFPRAPPGTINTPSAAAACAGWTPSSSTARAFPRAPGAARAERASSAPRRRRTRPAAPSPAGCYPSWVWGRVRRRCCARDALQSSPAPFMREKSTRRASSLAVKKESSRYTSLAASPRFPSPLFSSRLAEDPASPECPSVIPPGAPSVIPRLEKKLSSCRVLAAVASPPPRPGILQMSTSPEMSRAAAAVLTSLSPRPEQLSTTFCPFFSVGMSFSR